MSIDFLETTYFLLDWLPEENKSHQKLTFQTFSSADDISSAHDGHKSKEETRGWFETCFMTMT